MRSGGGGGGSALENGVGAKSSGGGARVGAAAAAAKRPTLPFAAAPPLQRHPSGSKPDGHGGGRSGGCGGGGGGAWLCNDLALRSRTVRTSVRVSTAMAALSFAGIGVTLCNVQLRDSGRYALCSPADEAAKLVVSALTAALLLLLLYYHFLQFRLRCLTLKAGSMLVAVAAERERLLMLAAELLVCALHPLPACFATQSIAADDASSSSSAAAPLGRLLASLATAGPPTGGDVASNWTAAILSGNGGDDDDEVGGGDRSHGSYKWHATSGDAAAVVLHSTEVERLLCVAMLLRVYQLARFLFLRSKLFATILNYSLRALAHSRYNYGLIFRSYLYMYEGYALLAIGTGGLAALSCGLYLCESGESGTSGGLSGLGGVAESTWVVLITFLTIGYGDRVPKTYCGRATSVLAGLFGSLCMGLAVSVLLRYMQPSYDELLTLGYLGDADLAKRSERMAAAVIVAAWRAHRSARELGGGSATRGGSGGVAGDVWRSLVAFGHRCRLLRALRERRELLHLRSSRGERLRPIWQLFNLRVQHRDASHQLRQLADRQEAAARAVRALRDDMARVVGGVDALSALVRSSEAC